MRADNIKLRATPRANGAPRFHAVYHLLRIIARYHGAPMRRQYTRDYRGRRSDGFREMGAADILRYIITTGGATEYFHATHATKTARLPPPPFHRAHLTREAIGATPDECGCRCSSGGGEYAAPPLLCAFSR